MHRPNHASGPRRPLVAGMLGLALLGAGGLAARLLVHPGASPPPARAPLTRTTPTPIPPRPSATVPPSPDGASTSPAGTLPAEPLPRCDVAEVPTELPSYDDWQRTVLDGRFALPAGYEPPDLVSVRLAGFDHDLRVRSFVIPDLEALGEAAAEAGHPLSMVSAYRGFAQQAALFDKRVAELGYDTAVLHTARPGHSEHQLGTTIDFVTFGATKVTRDWLNEPTGRWMSDNAWRYGFVMSYPEGREAVTCYAFEPWHYRYVGRVLAAKIHRSGRTPRQYLWEQEHGGGEGAG
jgi:zinc D-Ala-D-Ala carboxypeptidase